MNPQEQISTGKERIEQLPAQEKVAHGIEANQVLTAEQVYQQRMNEDKTGGQMFTQDFIS